MSIKRSRIRLGWLLLGSASFLAIGAIEASAADPEKHPPERRQQEQGPTKPANTWVGKNSISGDHRLVAQQLVDPQKPRPDKPGAQGKNDRAFVESH